MPLRWSPTISCAALVRGTVRPPLGGRLLQHRQVTCMGTRVTRAATLRSHGDESAPAGQFFVLPFCVGGASPNSLQAG